MDTATIERFWNKVNKDGPQSALAPELGNCWVWTSGLDNRGNGKFWADDGTHRAHRFSWRLAHGDDRGRGYVVQICGNPLCVRPEHLSDDPKARRKRIRHEFTTSAQHHCRECGAVFTIKASAAARGHGKFCSRRCFRTQAARASSDRDAAASERFWPRVDKSGPIPGHVPHLGNCWTWTGPLSQFGYGAIWFEGDNIGAHRFSFELAHGAVPAGLFVCHKCDNRSCVRTDHLFLGTQQDNIADRDSKNRQAKGERIKSSRMTEAHVEAIFELRARGLSQLAIAAAIGFSHQTVSSVLTGRGWAHVSRRLDRLLPRTESR